MRPIALALLVAGLLGGCGKYESNLQGADHEPIPTKDADWREVGRDKGFYTVLSFASIGHDDASGNDQYAYVWVLRKFAEEQKPTDKGEDPFNREYVRFAIDCEKSTMAGIAIERYYRKSQDFEQIENENDAKNEPTSRKDVPGYQWEFIPITPGTYQQEFARQVCGVAKIKADKPASKKK